MTSPIRSGRSKSAPACRQRRRSSSIRAPTGQSCCIRPTCSSTKTAFATAPTGAAPGSTSWSISADRRSRSFRRQSRCGGARVTPREAREQIVDFRLGGRAETGAGLALRVRSENAAPLHHIFAHGEADALLLLVADQRQMRVEQVVRGVALAFASTAARRRSAFPGRRSRSSRRRRRAPSRNRGTARRCRSGSRAAAASRPSGSRAARRSSPAPASPRA